MPHPSTNKTLARPIQTASSRLIANKNIWANCRQMGNKAANPRASVAIFLCRIIIAAMQHIC
jgi:hypothetical protein